MENPGYLKEPIVDDVKSVPETTEKPEKDPALLNGEHAPVIDNQANAKKEKEEKERDPKNYVAHISEVSCHV